MNKQYGGSLTEHSDRISKAILKVKSIMYDTLHNIDCVDPMYQQCMNCVRLLTIAPVFPDVSDKNMTALPKEYQLALIASTFASHYVYRRGIQAVEGDFLSRALAQNVMDYFKDYTDLDEQYLVARDLNLDVRCQS